MMNKLIPPNSYMLGEKQVAWLKRSSRGIVGDDLNNFIKRANARIANDIKKLAFAPGEVPIHLIALASDIVNRNGDIFDEQTCRDHHNEFVKNARWYRNHVNTNKAKSYGIVKYSTYNEEMKRIELVVALNGTKEAADRNKGLVADQELEKLASDAEIGVSMACFLDPDFPVLTRDRGYVAIKNITTNDHVWTHKGRWRKVVQLNRRIYSGKTCKVKVNGLPITLNVTADHPMLSIIFSHNYCLTAAETVATRYFKNTDEFNQIKPKWETVENVNIGDRFLHKPVTHYSGYGQIADENLATLMGRRCENKIIPPEIFNADENVKLAFLGAWLDGDGWLDKKGAHWSTKNFSLVMQGRDLLAAMGIPSSIYKINHKERIIHNNKKPIPANTEYTLNISHLEAQRLNKYSEKAAKYPIPVTRSRTKPACLRPCMDDADELIYACRIKDISYEDVTDAQTYNIEVEEDESYSAAGLISHNCKVQHDLCNSCHNKAASRADYCESVDDGGMCKHGGCKHNLCRVSEDGHILGVFNPKAKFFDISMVFRPADRIAYVFGELNKEASHVKGGAYLAEQLNIQSPYEVDVDFISNDSIRFQCKLAKELAQLEETTLTSNTDNPGLLTKVSNIEGLGRNNKTRCQIIKALAQEKIALSLTDFLKFISPKDKDITKIASVVEQALPTIFTRLSSNLDNLINLIQNNPFVPSNEEPSDAIKSLVKKSVFSASFADNHLTKRAWHNSIKNVQVKNINLPMEKLSSTVDNLAIAYGLYKLAFLNEIKHNNDFEQIKELIVQQNFVS